MQTATKELIKATAKPKSKPSSQPVGDTVDDLKGQFNIARTSEDWVGVAKLAREISRAERAKVEADREAKITKVSFLRDCFRKAIEATIQDLCDNLSEDELVLVEGIWLSKDFGNGDFDVTITKDRMPKTRAKKSA